MVIGVARHLVLDRRAQLRVVGVPVFMVERIERLRIAAGKRSHIAVLVHNLTAVENMLVDLNGAVGVYAEVIAPHIRGHDLAGNHALTQRVPVDDLLTGCQTIVRRHPVIPVAGMKQVGQLLVRQAFIFGMNHAIPSCRRISAVPQRRERFGAMMRISPRFGSLM